MQPMGLAYIAGMTRKIISTKIIGANIMRKNYDWIADSIKLESPKIVLGGLLLRL